jgi:hypothetical protein
MAARIINVEKSQYLTQNIETFTKNKVGQYSKFLDKNPFFITYLAINYVESRSDVGTGGIESDIGPKSPIRFNRINHLPAYNLPDLRPDIDYDEINGYDINLEINDAVLLPNTIKPKSGDYLILKIPNSIEVAFRVNAFQYNTIQSNDFYTFSADLKYTGKQGESLIDRFTPQIVETYETIFENIGTEDKCFIRSTDIDKLRNVGLLFQELRDLYKTNFFDSLTGNFVCKNNDENPDYSDDSWYYDKYVERFIMESEIYYTENDENSIILAPADMIERSDQWYPRTLFSAVLKHDTAYLGRFPYCYQVGIQKPLSVFVINQISCKGVFLHITNYQLIQGHSDGLDSRYLYEYFPHRLIHYILDNDDIEDTIEHKYDPQGRCWKDLINTREESLYEDDGDKAKHGDGRNHREFDKRRDASDSSKSESKELCRRDDRPNQTRKAINPEPYEFTYLDEIVYNYLLNNTLVIDRQKLVQFSLQVNNYTYRMMPIIIYIISEYYNSYFKTDSDIEL